MTARPEKDPGLVERFQLRMNVQWDAAFDHLAKICCFSKLGTGISNARSYDEVDDHLPVFRSEQGCRLSKIFGRTVHGIVPRLEDVDGILAEWCKATVQCLQLHSQDFSDVDESILGTTHFDHDAVVVHRIDPLGFQSSQTQTTPDLGTRRRESQKVVGWGRRRVLLHGPGHVGRVQLSPLDKRLFQASDGGRLLKFVAMQPILDFVSGCIVAVFAVEVASANFAATDSGASLCCEAADGGIAMQQEESTKNEPVLALRGSLKVDCLELDIVAVTTVPFVFMHVDGVLLPVARESASDQRDQGECVRSVVKRLGFSQRRRAELVAS
mmetsp:Transcript_5823/g.17339  ORF Transcript_5823/g.17339 Transcript_5823/m.17339 type:complete len:326 (-) Transcript_5823:1768-2745(-)